MSEQRKTKIYIAGPMTGYKNHNFPAFDAARDVLKVFGFEPISPADLDRKVGITEKSTKEETDAMMRQMIHDDALAISECDAIYMLVGWEKSTGARAEHAMAVWMQIPIYYQQGIF